MENEKYIFDPLKHGFERIQKYPELSFNFPMIDLYYVKIVCGGGPHFGDLVYWYKVIMINAYQDDRVRIRSGVYDFRKPCEYREQSTPNIEYVGLISSDKFAESLLKHLLGTTKNNSVEKEGDKRYKDGSNIGEEIREKFKKYYK